MNPATTMRAFIVFVSALTLAGFVATAAGAERPTAEEAVKVLTEGNERFASGRPAYPQQSAARRAEIAPAQHPIATIIACSDSRVPPEILFDEGIGDLFVVRVIGNIGGADETGSAEYGVEHLGTPLLVVLEHSRCGAVTAAVTHAEVHGSIPPLLAHIEPAVETARCRHPELAGEALIAEAVRTNVFHSIEELFRRSAIIRERVAAGELKVLGGVYDIQSGRVEWLGAHPEESKLVSREARKDLPKKKARE